MRRRHFLTLLGAAVAWPRPVIGQSPSKVYRVGLLSAGAPIADNSSQGAALIRGFTQRGYTLGRNLAFERRGAEGHIDRLPRLVDELAASKVDVIVTFGYPAALACKQATTRPMHQPLRRRCHAICREPYQGVSRNCSSKRRINLSVSSLSTAGSR